MTRASTGLAAVLTLLALAGCSRKPASQGAAPPAPKVIVVPAQRQPVAETLSLVGSLSANEIVELKSEAEGVVSEILFREGEQVEKGQVLIRLDETKLRAAVNECEANFRLSHATHERNRQLLSEKLVSQQEFDQSASAFEFNRATLELRRRQLADTRIVAPFEGLVGARSVSPGQVISRNTTLTWLIDLDPIKVEMAVPERFLSQLKIGQRVSFDVAAYPGRKFEGEVYFIASNVDELSRTALVKALIPNPGNALKAGMFARLDLTLKVREDAVVIPEVALLVTGATMSVLVVDKEQVARLTPVEVGTRLAGRVEIVSGLGGGELVIVEGLQKAIPGRPVRSSPADNQGPYRQEAAPATRRATSGSPP